MPSKLFFNPGRSAIDLNGLVVPGAELFFYQTDSTLKMPIYADAELTVELTNPVVANGAGRWPNIYLDDAISYRTRAVSSSEILFDVDPYYPGTVSDVLPDVAEAVVTATRAAVTAEAARDIAQAAVGVDYADAAAALAGAANGDKFTYWDGDDIIFATKTGGALVELTGPWFGADKISTSSGENLQTRLNRMAHSEVSDLLASTAAAVGEGAIHRAGPYVYREAGAAATDHHITNAAGVKMYVMPIGGGLPLGAFGVDETGVAVADTTIAKAIAAAESLGGARLIANAGAVIKNNATHEITSSDILLDLRGGRLEGSGQFWWNGTGTFDGDRSASLSGVGIVDAYFGDTHKGPRFDFCDNPLAKRITRLPGNTNGTWINVLKCRGGTIEDVTSWDSEATKIGALLHLCDEVKVRGFYLFGGEYVYGIQVKGGLGNSVRDGLQRGIKVNHGWRDRGDAPWNASTSTGIYPWTTGSWAAADIRRASRRTFFENLHSENVTKLSDSSAIHFYAFEAIRHQSNHCSSDGSGATGYFAAKASGGSEHGYKISRFDFAGNGTAQTGVSISSLATTRLDDVVLEDCNISGVTGGNAINAEKVSNLRISGGQYNGCTGQEAIALADCMNPTVEKVTGTSNSYGLRILTNPTGSIPKIRDNDFSGNSTAGWSCFFPCEAEGNKGNPTHSFNNSATTVSTVQRFGMADGESWVVELTVDYKLSGGQAGRFAKTLTASKAGGTIAMSALTNIHADMNTDTLTGFTVTNSGNTELRMNIGGKTGDSGTMSVTRVKFTGAGT